MECDIRADLSETSECEIFLKSILKDSEDKSDEEQRPCTAQEWQSLPP